jgi:hypothetical protein
MYLLLVTNRQSNILEDLDTLRLLSKLVPEYAGAMLDEESVARAAFDLIFAFDEVISNGHKENITVQQVGAAGGGRAAWPSMRGRSGRAAQGTAPEGARAGCAGAARQQQRLWPGV